MTPRRISAGLCLLVLCHLPARAAHPLLTEDTGTQGEGNFQLELMVDKTRDHPAGATVREMQTTAVLSYGLRENMDLQLGLPWLRQHTQDALGGRHDSGRLDTSLDLKWRFFERDALSLAVKPGITLPTGDEDRGFGSGRVTWGSLLVLSYAPGPWALHAHVGYRRNDNSVGERQDLWHASAAATWQATEGLRLVADLTAESNPDRSRRASHRYGVLGFIYSVMPTLDLDAGVKHGRGGGATDHAVLFGLTFRW